jgi:hypothetical protein
MTDVCRCAVPHCPRSRKLRRGESGDSEWLCPDHWAMTSPSARRRMQRLVKRARAPDCIDPMWAQLATDMWTRLKAQAIERAAGIA